MKDIEMNRLLEVFQNFIYCYIRIFKGQIKNKLIK